MSGAQRLQESSTDSRDHAIRKNYKGETECLLIHKVIMPKVSQMKSVRNVSRSGEKGGMTTNLLTKIKCFLLTGEVVLHPIWGALNKPSLRIVKNEIFIFNICLYWYTSITRT